MVALVKVSPATLVTVDPKVSDVLPSVIAVAKLLSNWLSGNGAVALANIYGTVIVCPYKTDSNALNVPDHCIKESLVMGINV